MAWTTGLVLSPRLAWLIGEHHFPGYGGRVFQAGTVCEIKSVLSVEGQFGGTQAGRAMWAEGCQQPPCKCMGSLPEDEAKQRQGEQSLGPRERSGFVFSLLVMTG